MKKILFRAKASGHVIELMRFDKPGPNQGDSLTRQDTGQLRYKPARTDIVIRGELTPRTPLAKGKGLAPRGRAEAHVSGMEAKSQMAGTKPANPAQMLRAGRGGAALADRGKVDVTAPAGWFGKDKGLTKGQHNRRLRSVYDKFDMKPDAAKIKAELATGATKVERQTLGKLIQQTPQLLRRAKG